MMSCDTPHKHGKTLLTSHLGRLVMGANGMLVIDVGDALAFCPQSLLAAKPICRRQDPSWWEHNIGPLALYRREIPLLR